MASISEINAKAANKSERNENEPVDIKVRIGVFFDGTNNNRAQVMMGRLAREKEGIASKQEIKENDEILEDMELDKLDLFERFYIEKSNVKKKAKRKVLNFRNIWRPGMPRNPMQKVGFTNIAILERFYNPSEQNDYIYKVYVTGSGTNADSSEGVNIVGLAAGQGSTGVVQKVWDALDAIYTRISFFNFDKSISGVNYVFDVFGFSRGATETRLFVDLCCNRGNRPSVLRKGIKTYNKKFSNKENSSEDKIQFPKQKDIKFNVGIYDTVASVGVIRKPQWAPPALSGPVTGIELLSKTASTFHDENVNDLGLDTVANDSSVQKVVHICALDEYRENFALCALPVDGKVEQFFMPGIHTDIGGSEIPDEYRDEVSIPVRVMEKHIQPDIPVYQETHQYYYTHERLFIPRVAPLNETFEMTFDNLNLLGWLKEGDKFGKKRDYYENNTDYDNIDVRRYSKGLYSNLPLVIMAEQYSVVFDNGIGNGIGIIKGKHAIPSELPDSFENMKSLWNGCNSNYGHCYFPRLEEEYKNLRLRYLHFSSSAGSVNGPHYNDNYCYERILYTQNGEDTLRST